MITTRWQIGDKIANRYEIYRIMAGGMGIVYICYDHEHESPYVLKTFQDKYLLSEGIRDLFEREALIWTQLERYPYIVRAHYVARLEARLFIVLEYIASDEQGRNSLGHYLGSISLSETLKFAIQFCYGMEYAYSKGLEAHRDIKPDNIMITADKTVKITDFGLAKAFQELQFEEGKLKSSKESTQGLRLSIFRSKGKQVCGTLPYMAPEQFDGHADKRSDVYSFGIVLYQMVMDGKLPFSGNTVSEYEKLHKKGRVTSVSSPLFPMISKCLEKKPDRRFQNFAQIREELQKILYGETGEKIIPPETEELDAYEQSNKGIALGNLGRYEEAIRCHDEALRINPKCGGFWCNKGTTLTGLGRHDKAIACYDEAIRMDPRNYKAWCNKGNALVDLGDADEAIKCYDKAIEIDPRLAALWSYKGNALVDLGDADEAIKCHDKAIRIDPGDTSAWFNKGVALAKLGRYDEAIKCYDKAIRIDPGDTSAWSNKGVALAKLGQYDEAIKCYDEALEIDPRLVKTWCNKGNALRNLGDADEAIRCYDKALILNPKHASAWRNKGATLYVLGIYDEALRCFDEAIRLKPDYTAAHKLRQMLLEELGQ